MVNNKNSKREVIFYDDDLTIDEKFDVLDGLLDNAYANLEDIRKDVEETYTYLNDIGKHLDGARDVMLGAFHNSRIHVDYIVQLREQIKSLGGTPLSYPDDLLEEYMPDLRPARKYDERDINEPSGHFAHLAKRGGLAYAHR